MQKKARLRLRDILIVLICTGVCVASLYFFWKDLDVFSLKLQKEEVQSVQWASREEVLELRDEELFLSYPKSLIELVFDIGQRKD